LRVDHANVLATFKDKPAVARRAPSLSAAARDGEERAQVGAEG